MSLTRGFYFLRHGETDWNVQNRMQGQIPSVPLNANGIAQAHKAAPFLAPLGIELILCSPLDRARATAAILNENLRLPISYDERLIERSWGVAEGKTYGEFPADPTDPFYRKDGRRDWISDTPQPEGSETREALADRAAQAIHDLLGRHAGQKVLFVTHGAWLRALVFRLTGRDQIFANALPYRAQERDGAWEIESVFALADKIPGSH